jgi:hypothetical protein
MNPALWPFVFYLLGSLCFVIGTLIAMAQLFAR